MSETALFSKPRYSPLSADLALDAQLAKLPDRGHFLLFGAPGAGKTTQLRLLAQKLGREKGANSVLAVTASRESAAELRNSLLLDIGLPSHGPIARSLSSLAYWLLDSSYRKKGLESPKLLSGASQLELIAELVNEAKAAGKAKDWKLPLQSVGLMGFAQELRDLLGVFLERGYSIEQIAEFENQFPNLKLSVLLDIYPSYLNRIKQLGLMDSAELLSQALKVLQAEPELLEKVQQVLIDDAQELTPAAFALVAELASKRSVGFFLDPDATVLGFRGALGAELPIQVKQNLKNVHEVFLQANHSVRFEGIGQLLNKISNRIPASNAGKQRKSLLENNSATGEVTQKVFQSSNQELDFLATEIRKLKLVEEVASEEIVVIARTRPQLERLQQGLASRGVATRIQGSQAALREQFASRSLLTLALAILDPEKSDASLVKEILTSAFCGLDSLGLRRLTRQLSFKERSAGLARSQDEILQELIRTQTHLELEGPEAGKLKRLQELIVKIRESENLKPHQLVSEIWDASGLAPLWQERARGRSEVALAANRDLDSMLEFFAAAKRFQDRNPAATALDFVNYQLRLAIPEDSLAPIGLQDAVVLATPSSLIGKRFKFGFLPRLQDGIWPNLRPRNSLLGASAIEEYLRGRSDDPLQPARNELVDELRLLYKSVGSVAERIWFTAMQSLEEQPSQIFNILFGRPSQPETFVREFDLRHRVGRLRQQLAKTSDSQAALELASLSELGVAGANPAGWFGLLPASSEAGLYDPDQSVFVSPSKIENFEKCPLHWFISEHGGDGSGFEASLGTLIHAALEKARDNADQLVPAIDSLWHELEFEAQWQSAAQRQKALAMLANLAQYLEQKSAELVQAEAEFNMPIGRLVIAGKIDRLEKTSAGIFVADLKTGKVGTKEEVAQNRQLALYQLAAQKVLVPDQKVLGAKIISVSPKLSTPEQGPLEGELLQQVEDLLKAAELGMSGNTMLAVVSEHCSGDENCQLLLARQVTELG